MPRINNHNKNNNVNNNVQTYSSSKESLDLSDYDIWYRVQFDEIKDKRKKNRDRTTERRNSKISTTSDPGSMNSFCPSQKNIPSPLTFVGRLVS